MSLEVIITKDEKKPISKLFDKISNNITYYSRKISNKIEDFGLKTFAYSMNNHKGVQLGPIFAVVRGDFKGLQMSTFLNEVGGDLYGVAFSGYNTVEENVKGGLHSFGANIIKGYLEGYEIGLTNYAKKVNGFTLGLTNATEELVGSRVSIVGSSKTAKGVLIDALASSVTERFDGLMISTVCHGPENGNYFQMGLVTIREGNGPWYKRITPFIGWNREKRNN